MKAAHLIISGHVHGVGFRQFIKSNAQKLGLVGWVQNSEDRTVEVMLQGEKEAVEAVIELCKIGPMLAEVRNVSINWMEETFSYTEFEVL